MIHFHYLKKYIPDQSIRKIFYIFWKTEAMVLRTSRCEIIDASSAITFAKCALSLKRKDGRSRDIRCGQRGALTITQQAMETYEAEVGMASNNIQPPQFLGLFYLNDTEQTWQLGPLYIAQRHPCLAWSLQYWLHAERTGSEYDRHTSASFLAELSARSSRKFTVFIIYNKKFWIEASEKYVIQFWKRKHCDTFSML